MAVRLINTYDECQHLCSDWNNIVLHSSKDILQLDVTCTFEWAMMLWRNHLDRRDGKILVLERDDTIVGILPLFASTKVAFPVRYKVLSPLTQVYCGRSGFLLKEPLLENVDLLTQYLYDELSDWDTFVFYLVDDSPSAKVLDELVKQRGYPCEKAFTVASPYIVFDKSWDNYFSSLPKKLRWTIRTGEKKLRDRGHLLYSEYTEESQASFFAEAMIEIERESWKETAGTSISSDKYQESFHREFTAIAAKNGWFSGHLIQLDGEPVAYISGLIYNGFFYDLKESFKSKYGPLSPGHVLKRFAFERLIEQHVHTYDIMGLCEDYKMRWTDKTYAISTYVLYNHTVTANFVKIRSQLASILKRPKAVSRLREKKP